MQPTALVEHPLPLLQWIHSRFPSGIPEGRLETHYPWCEYTFPFSIKAALALLEAAAPRIKPDPRHLAYARHVLRVPETELAAWHAQAWWGHHAALACRNRLVTPKREREVINLVDPVDWRPLDTLLAQGRGVILAQAHSGVPHILGALLSLAGRPPARITAWRRFQHPGIAAARTGNRPSYTLPYLQSFMHLRAGGIVAAAPDGPVWQQAVEERFCGHPCRVSLGLAALARLTGAPAIPCIALWKRHRIRIEFGEPMLPGARHDGSEDRTWTRKYLDWLECMVKANPRAVRFDQLHPRVNLLSDCG